MKQLSNDAAVKLKTVGIALTMQCNFNCAHCITESGPHKKDKINFEDAIKLINAVSSESSNICFTGGESLLCKETLFDCIQESYMRGLTISLVTNGFWAKDEKCTRLYLKKLSEVGLSGICISLDQFHLPFAKIENAIRIAKLSKEFGINHLIRVCAVKNDYFADSIIDKKKFPNINFQRVRVLPMGRAKQLPLSFFDYLDEIPTGSCSTVLSPIILPSGLVQACCGPGTDFIKDNPLNLGNWKEDEISQILRRARTNPLVMALYSFGPKYLYDIISKEKIIRKDDIRHTFAGICELCVDMCNNKKIVNLLENLFDNHEMKLKLIASQVYQQSHMFLKKINFLDLPD